MKNPIPQQEAATALAQLLAEYPELPRMRWSIGPNGSLGGTVTMFEDPRPAMAQYVAVLGGKAWSLWPGEDSSAQTFSTWLFVTWRGVELSVWMGCDAVLVPREQVAQVAA